MRVGVNQPDAGDRRYIARAMKTPLLTREHEANLARRWREEHDEAAMRELVEAYGRLVVRVALRFRGYGLPVADLIQEGQIGLLEAAARFDTAHNTRFSTYAVWWIVAAIQSYVLRNSSVVRLATTRGHRRLFFRLRQLRARAGQLGDGAMSDEDRARIAKDLSVTVDDVAYMEGRLSGPDASLNDPVPGADSGELQDVIADERPGPEELFAARRGARTRRVWLNSAIESLSSRERRIIERRFLHEDRATLGEIGEEIGVTRERVRQIESRALAKLRGALETRWPEVRDLIAA